MVDVRLMGETEKTADMEWNGVCKEMTKYFDIDNFTFFYAKTWEP
jgi:hypothetical protein